MANPNPEPPLLTKLDNVKYWQAGSFFRWEVKHQEPTKRKPSYLSIGLDMYTLKPKMANANPGLPSLGLTLTKN